MDNSDFIVDIQEKSRNSSSISFFGLQYSFEKPATHIQRTILSNGMKVYSQNSNDDSRYKVPDHINKSIGNLRSAFGPLKTKPRNASQSFSSQQSPETRHSYVSTSSSPNRSNSIGKSTPTGKSSGGSPSKSTYSPSPSKRGSPYSGSSPGSPEFKYSPMLGIPREMQEKLHESRNKVIESKQQADENSRKHFKPKKANWSPSGYNTLK